MGTEERKRERERRERRDAQTDLSILRVLYTGLTTLIQQT